MSESTFAPGMTADIDGAANEEGTIEWQVAYGGVLPRTDKLQQVIKDRWFASDIAKDLIGIWETAYGAGSAQRGGNDSMVNFPGSTKISFRRVEDIVVTQSNKVLVEGASVELGPS